MRVVCFTPFEPRQVSAHAGGRHLTSYLGELDRLGHEVVSVSLDGEGDLRVSDFRDGLRSGRAMLGSARPSSMVSRISRIVSVLGRGLDPGSKLLCAYRRAFPELRALLARADVVDVQFGQMLPLVPSLKIAAPSAKILYHAHDVMSQSMDRARMSPHLQVSLPARTRYRAIRKQEAQFLGQCDLVVVLNQSNARLVTALGVEASAVRHVPPYVPLNVRQADLAHESVIFVGAFERRENSEGLEWFLRRVWPGVAKSLPDALLRVVGPGAEGFRALANSNPRVELRGFVDDLDAEYLASSVAVAPLLRGAGIKVKVLEAMAYGVPVVATSIAAEGIAEFAPEGIPAVADTPSEFSKALLALLCNNESRTVAGQASRDWINRSLDFGAAVSNLCDELDGGAGAK